MPDEEPRQPEPLPPSLDDIDSAPPVIPPSAGDLDVSAEDYADKLAEVSADKERLKEQVEAETHRILNDLIKPCAERAFTFMWFYCGGVFTLLVLHGFGFLDFALPDSTLDFLVGTTGLTVLGLVGMVLTGVFVGARKK